MSKIVLAVQNAARKVRASVPFGPYLPNNKIIAGALAAGVTVGLSRLQVVDIPTTYVSVGAFLLVSYLFPESPVAAAHVVAKAGRVEIQHTEKITRRQVVTNFVDHGTEWGYTDQAAAVQPSDVPAPPAEFTGPHGG